MKNKLMKLRGKITVIMMNMITCFLMAQNHVYAGGIGSSKLFTGTESMLYDMKKPLIGLSSAFGVVMIIYNLIRMKMGDDVDTKMYKKRIGIILICMVLVVSVVTLVSTILSYYK